MIKRLIVRNKTQYEKVIVHLKQKKRGSQSTPHVLKDQKQTWLTSKRIESQPIKVQMKEWIGTTQYKNMNNMIRNCIQTMNVNNNNQRQGRGLANVKTIALKTSQKRGETTVKMTNYKNEIIYKQKMNGHTEFVNKNVTAKQLNHIIDNAVKMITQPGIINMNMVRGYQTTMKQQKKEEEKEKASNEKEEKPEDDKKEDEKIEKKEDKVKVKENSKKAKEGKEDKGQEEEENPMKQLLNKVQGFYEKEINKHDKEKKKRKDDIDSLNKTREDLGIPKGQDNGNGGKNFYIFIALFFIILALERVFFSSEKYADGKRNFRELYQLFDLESDRGGKVTKIEYIAGKSVAYVFIERAHGGLEMFEVEAISFSQFENLMYGLEKLTGMKMPKISMKEDFSVVSSVVEAVFPLLFVIIPFIIFRYVMKNVGNMPGLGGQNKANPIKQYKEKVPVRFTDVAGMQEAKAEITEFVEFLKHPQQFSKLGAHIPRGALLTGPPGTGKTLLAKAVAGESEVPFFSVAGSDFVEMYVGRGASRVRELFKLARAKEKAIIYIDEIDAIGRKRGSSAMYGSNDERETTLNQLLVEMDGFGKRDGIVVMASTNVDLKDLDDALLRPGRFDRNITLEKPDKHEREDIYRVHLKPIELDNTIVEDDLVAHLAERTPGFVGAEIANVCNEGAIIAARNNGDFVRTSDFEKAIDRVVAGIEKANSPISPMEKKVIAYHEAGHAIAAHYCDNCDPLLKISIIPRGRALGYAQYVPKERFIRTYDQMKDMLVQAFGGRVAEKIVFNHLSTGAQDDLSKITNIAYSALSTYGMNEGIGPLSFPPPGYENMAVKKPYSQHFATILDNEARELIDQAFKRCHNILTEKRELLTIIAEQLIKDEVMMRDDFEKYCKEFDDKQQGKPKLTPAEAL